MVIMLNKYNSICQSAEFISDNAFKSNLEFFVTSKPKRGVPRKSGRALEVDDVVVESVTEIATKKKESKKMKIQRFVNFQPRS